MNTVAISSTTNRHGGAWFTVIVIMIAVFINSFFGTDALFITMGIATAAIVVFFGRNAAEYCILAMVLWFAAGYRTFTLFGEYKVHMLDLIPLLILILVLRGVMPGNERALHTTFRKYRRFILVGVVAATFYGLILALWNNVPIQNAVMVMKNFFIIVPLMIFVPRILQRPDTTRRMMWMLLVAGLLIAVPGIMEYHLGIFSAGSSYSDDFNRAVFSFWGATMAILVLTLCFQAHWFLWSEAKARRVQILLIASIVIQLYAIYISGTRQMWIATLIMAVLAIYLRLGAWKATIAIPIFLILLTFAPAESVNRIESFYFLKEADQYGRVDTRWLDSSGADRAVRMERALLAISEHPLGGGWSSSGWVHSDILSIGVDLGIIPGMIFITLLLSTTLKTFLRARQSKGPAQWRWLTYTGFMVTNVMLFSFGGVTWLIQYCMPAWFTWLLTEYHLHDEGPDAES